MDISPAQCRGARGLLEMTQRSLAEASGVSLRTITHFENSRRNPILANMGAIRTALEKAGVIFVEENGDGPGVRLRKTKRK